MAEELDSGSKDHPKLSGKISGKEQMALNYIGFFSHMHMKFKQFRQKKKGGLMELFHSSVIGKSLLSYLMCL